MSQAAECPHCGKSVQTHYNGGIRPHAVPVSMRVDTKKSEQCPGTGTVVA